MTRNPYLRHVVVAAVLWSVAYSQAAWAQEAIARIRQQPLQLYAEPSESATRREVAAPTGDAVPGNWVILPGDNPKFFRIQAGEHGTGWVRRSALTRVKGETLPCLQGQYAASGAAITGGSAGVGTACAR